MLCHLCKPQCENICTWDDNGPWKKQTGSSLHWSALPRKSLGDLGWSVKALTPMFLDLGIFPCAFSFTESVGIWDALGYLMRGTETMVGGPWII